MYTDVEFVEKANEDFIIALELLHSRDNDSAEKLKRMLNASIEKKLAIVHDRQRRVSPSASLFNVSSNDHRRTRIASDESEKRIVKNDVVCREYKEQTSSSSNFRNRRRNVNFESKKICTIELAINQNDDKDKKDESTENIDVPRISIPDENCDDCNVICKICKVDKLGPLIILECQDCQEAYHPLCHQPAVIEIDVYDPRLVWRCGKCLEIYDDIGESRKNIFSPIVVNLENDNDDDEEKKKKEKKLKNETKNILDRDVIFRKTRRSGLALKNIDDKETTKIRNKGRRRRRRRIENSQICGGVASMKNSSSVQLRKRVGSKISVNRLSTT